METAPRITKLAADTLRSCGLRDSTTRSYWRLKRQQAREKYIFLSGANVSREANGPQGGAISASKEALSESMLKAQALSAKRRYVGGGEILSQ